MSRQHVYKANLTAIACSACLLELARIVELEIDTDDQSDTSCKRLPNHLRSRDTNPTNDDNLDGVVVFLILSVAEEVCAMTCGSLPVVIPQLVREYKRNHSSPKSDHSYSTKLGNVPQSRGLIRGFRKLGGESSGDRVYEGQNLAGEQSNWPCGSIALNTVVAETPPHTKDPGDAQIVVKKEYEVTVGGSDAQAV